ncbi:hypothetical protein BCS37_02975 [Selenomonas sp. oral taxon 920]|uniref:hypothetical protein n=1 Tax=Selenomonas sp. oral taxon 920 TaxID=1884263 RepID=UPI000840C4B4|nr:hypothetical protein [Selenomonas sp. oral taxon 920]AOH47470.1 hypothetical protein BCS37_02975 [Selenomonas sp. oral taxon 920]
MKEICRYACEFCGVDFDSKEKAHLCESSHMIPKEIKSAKYVSSNAIGDPECNYANNYPENITIQMSNGEEVDYVRDRR